MKWGVSRVPKEDNCPPTTAAIGFVSGLVACGDEAVQVPSPTVDSLDPSAFDGFDIALVPYWVSRRVLSMDLAAVAGRVGAVVVYTGVAPFWEGCGYAEPDPFSNAVFSGPAATRTEERSLASVSMFATAWSRGNGPEVAVGCGHGEGCVWDSEPKSLAPGMTVFDFVKEGWDEEAAALAADGVALAQRAGCSVPVVALGVGASTALERSGAKSSRGFAENSPREHFLRLWSTASAVLVHNESFGYAIVEALASGCRVLAWEGSELPECHSRLVERWSGPEDLAEKILDLSTPEGEDAGRSRRSAWENDRCHAAFRSWDGAARRLRVEIRRRLGL